MIEFYKKKQKGIPFGKSKEKGEKPVESKFIEAMKTICKIPMIQQYLKERSAPTLSLKNFSKTILSVVQETRSRYGYRMNIGEDKIQEN